MNTTFGVVADKTYQMLGKTFIQRRDVKAFQRKTGAYKPIHSKWTLRDLKAHVRGKTTLGYYLVDHDGLTRVVAFDIDFDDEDVEVDGEKVTPREVFSDPDHFARAELTRQVRGLADGLAWRTKRMYPEIKVIVSFSGSKGIHVYGCFPQATDANAARTVGQTILNSWGGGEIFEPVKGKNFYKAATYPQMTVEVFPKQEKVGTGGFGNLLRLPLGVNQKTGRESFFYDIHGPITDLAPVDPALVLDAGSLQVIEE